MMHEGTGEFVGFGKRFGIRGHSRVFCIERTVKPRESNPARTETLDLQWYDSKCRTEFEPQQAWV